MDIYDQLGNIKITNKDEPRISFIVCTSRNNNGVLMESDVRYDICLSMIPCYLDGLENFPNMEELLREALKQIKEYAE